MTIRNVIYKGHRVIYAWHGNKMIPGLVIDHIDGDVTNNIIENLRQVTNAVNTQKRDNSRISANSTSDFTGVSMDLNAGKWKSQISANGRKYHLGLFTSEVDAAIARDAKVKELGTAHMLNFPDF